MTQCNDILSIHSISGVVQNKSISRQLPILCSIGLTSLCNLKCRMCAFTYSVNDELLGSRYLSIDEWKSIAIQLREIGILYLSITGGEPTTYPEFPSLYSFLHKQGFLITLKTNATYLTKEVKKVLIEYPPHKVYISVYGGSNETYKSVCSDDKGYSKLLNGIEFYKSISTSISTTVTVIKQNVIDIPDICKMLAQYGLRAEINTDIIPHVDKNKHTSYLTDRLSSSERYIVLNSNPDTVLDNLQSVPLYENIISEMDTSLKCNRTCSKQGACLNASLGCHITWNGKMQYCQNYSLYQADVLTYGVSKSWELLREWYYEAFTIPSKCVRCNYKEFCHSNCPARFYVENGDRLKPTEYTCEYAYLEYNQRRGE